jgi:heterodisulfide reductase subunit C
MELDLENLGARDPLRRRVEELSGEHLADCYQCGCCTAGCPTAYQMEHGPHRVIRLLQLGAGEELLELDTPWICASCETCATRCPKGVSIAEVMDALRQIARMRGVSPPNPNARVFNDRFLGTMRRHGRVFELEVGLFYNLSSGNFFNHIAQFPALVFSGKMKPIPDRAPKKARKRMRRIMDRVAELERGGEVDR